MSNQTIHSGAPIRALIAGRDFPNFFEKDLFSVRRGSAQGHATATPNTSGLFFCSGVPYDPASLLTGLEIAQGLGYQDPRVWNSYEDYLDCVAGNWTTAEVEVNAPRVSRYTRGLSFLPHTHVHTHTVTTDVDTDTWDSEGGFAW